MSAKRKIDLNHMDSMGQKPNTSPKPRFNDVKFVTYDPPKEVQAQLKTWLTTFDQFDDALLKFCEEGYKLTFKWDSYNHAWSAFASPEGDNPRNKGYILTGRGSTPLKAAKRVFYAHWTAFDTDWVAGHEQNRGEEFDD